MSRVRRSVSRWRPKGPARSSGSRRGGLSLAGRLVMGAVSDLIGRRAALALQALSFVGLALPTGAPSLLLASALYGFAYGAVTALMPAIVADFFGPAHAGSLAAPPPRSGRSSAASSST